MKLTTNTQPLLIIRLGSKWTNEREEIESGYFRLGKGWYNEISNDELADSVRAWWVLSPETVEKKGIEHIVAYANGCTQAVYRIENVLGPRGKGKRYAFQIEQLHEGKLFDQVIGDEGMTIEFKKGSANPIRYWP